MFNKFKYAGLWCIDIGRVSIIFTDWSNGYYFIRAPISYGTAIAVWRLLVHIRNKGFPPYEWIRYSKQIKKEG